MIREFVAFSFLHPTKLGDKGLRLRRDAETGSYDAAKPYHFVLTMPHFPGKNLSAWQPLDSLTKICAVLEVVVIQLELLHKAGVAHLDIKPINVMPNDGEPHSGGLIDTGLCSVLGKVARCGTLGYRVPGNKGCTALIEDDMWAILITLLLCEGYQPHNIFSNYRKKLQKQLNLNLSAIDFKPVTVSGSHSQKICEALKKLAVLKGPQGMFSKVEDLLITLSNPQRVNNMD